MTRRTLIAVGLVVLALVTVAGVGMASDIYAIDDNHELDSDHQVEQFDDAGVATASVDAPDVDLTVAKQSDDVEHDAIVDGTKTYLRVQYNEDVPRTVRVYVPRDYWTPYEDQRLDSADGSISAEMEPINSREHSAITMHFDGEADVVFEISNTQASLWSVRERGYETVNGTTGYQLPRLSGSENNPWTYVAPTEFAGDETYAVNDTSATIQYNAAEDDSDSVWVPVAGCQGATDQPVCTLDRGDEVIIVPDDGDDAPTVRYKSDASFTEDLAGGFREVGEMFDGYIGELQDAIGGILG